MLADNDHFDTINDLRREDLDVLVEALSEFDGDAFCPSVVVDEDIAVVSADEFLYGLIRSHDGFGFAETYGRGDIHTRTKQVLAVGNDHFDLEGVAGAKIAIAIFGTFLLSNFQGTVRITRAFLFKLSSRNVVIFLLFKLHFI